MIPACERVLKASRAKHLPELPGRFEIPVWVVKVKGKPVGQRIREALLRRKNEVATMGEFVVGAEVRWTGKGATATSVGRVTDRTKDGQFRPSPDARGRYLVDWGGHRRWSSQLVLVG